MKLLRLFLILVLAALLPVRGALAVAMVCAPLSVPAALAPAPQAAHDHDHAIVQAQPDAPGADVAAESPHTAHAAHATACTACALFCALTPLTDSAPLLRATVALPAASFPPLVAQATRFERDGLERPPRTV